MNLTGMRKEFATKVGVSQEKAKELIAALEEVAKEVCMQVAAANPLFLSREQVRSKK